MRPDSAAACGRQDESGVGGIFLGHADGFVEGDLFGRNSARQCAGEQLAELGVDVIGGDDTVADRLEEVVATGREGRERGAPGLDAHQRVGGCGVVDLAARAVVSTDVTCTPGLSRVRRITGSTAWVAAAAMSGPSSAAA